MGKKKQEQIPGTARAGHADIDQAAIDYRAIRDRRMALTQKESELKAQLGVRMHEHNLEEYRFEDDAGDMVDVFVDRTEKVRVRKATSETVGVSDGE